VETTKTTEAQIITSVEEEDKVVLETIDGITKEVTICYPRLIINGLCLHI